MITILGPTACGKTSLAVALARRIGNAEILSADSRQVYRGMDIGTGKDLSEFGASHTDYKDNKEENPSCPSDSCKTADKPVRYHLIDIAEPGTKYNLYEYQRDFHRAYDDIRSRGAVPILCGGTGLYIEAVLRGYQLSPVPQNPELRERLSGKTLEELTALLKTLKAKTGSNMHNTTDVDSAQRAIRAIEIETYNLEHPVPLRAMPPIDSLTIGVAIGRDERRRRITQRLKDRLGNGMVEEVRGLLENGVKADDLMYYGLEYKYVTEYVIGRRTYDEMFRDLETAIHQFAKRQMTWFRGMERRGLKINWIDATAPMKAKVDEIISLWQ